MRCPKCHYISFDAEDRCRNCGYDLSLAPPAADPDLTIARAEGDGGTPADLDLALEGPAAPARDADRAAGAEPRSDEPFDLPLFDDEGTGRPAVLPPSARRERPARRPSEAREPAVREPPGAPEPVRRAFEPTLLDEAPDDALSDDREPPGPAGVPPAPLGTRLAAGLIDLFVLAIIDLVVLYLTRRVTGLEWAELGQLPLAPLLGFLFLLDAGYLIMFTAATGQTIGKSITGLRVVGVSSTRVPLGHAIARAVIYLFSIAPLGLGLLPVLVSADRRAWHDRIAGTRVVAPSIE